MRKIRDLAISRLAISSLALILIGFTQPATTAAAGLLVRGIAVGNSHSCALSTTGSVYCWGGNTFGQLGNGTLVTSPSPVPALMGGVSFVSLTAGGNHTCGLTQAGSAYCWGLGNNGELGDGQRGAGHKALQPTAVATTIRFSQLAAGARQTCGISLAGPTYCWGSNTFGELGIGTLTYGAPTYRTTPTKVQSGTNFIKIASGFSHVCGVNSRLLIFCWGSNDSGQLGNGASGNGSGDPGPADRGVPVQVQSRLRFTEISASVGSTCAISTDRRTYCWGGNGDWGALGVGDTRERSLTPVQVSTRETFVQLESGFLHTCGVTAFGVASCWGANEVGQLGNGDHDDSKSGSVHAELRPVFVARNTNSRFITLSLGQEHSCGITVEHKTYCWGSNTAGQLGNGVRDMTGGANQDMPTEVQY